MATIDCRRKICTLINVFTVEPEKQSELFELLKKSTKEVMNKMPGYISASLHVSDDGKTVTNYAQWASMSDYKNMLENPLAQQHMKHAENIATDFKPATYNFVWCE